MKFVFCRLKEGESMNLNKLLRQNRRKIFRQISDKLHRKGGEKYRERPFEELLTTTAEATDGFHAVLAGNDFSQIDGFIAKIAPMRLKSGFTSSDVQRAFDFYRIVLVPILSDTLQPNEFHQSLNKLNLAFTEIIAKFTDLFQELHEWEIRDLSRKLQEEVAARTKDLSESEAKYRVLVEDINDGYFVNQNGIIVFANMAFCEMHGCTMEELIGRSYLDLTAPRSTADVKTFYERHLNRQTSSDQYTYYRRHKNGRYFPTEIKMKVIPYNGTYAAAGICRDITERVKMERKIREAESLAHIGELTTSLAHEIRNPLASVKVGMQMLLKKGNLDASGRRTLEISSGEIARLERILESMLDTAKPLSLNFDRVNLNSIIDSCIELLQAKIDEKGIRLTKRLSQRVKSALLDKEKMEQVIINIVLNALEAVSFSGRISIVTKIGEKGKRANIVEITDNGQGISKEDLPYIFDPFFSKKKKGTGLGLAMVKKIVEAHGGQVSAFNRKKGLRLTFSIPING
ncbi:MAG: PAS domain S-box protein [Desulfobacteraceae bacterium]|nr:MAG: PAS domain S-box protein [Desulfobacteraceae bacterium]